jgi:hypothetical protein
LVVRYSENISLQTVKSVLLVVCALMLVSCLDEPDCIRNADTALIIQFKRLLDGKNDTLIFYRVEATGTDSIFYGQQPDVLDTLRGTAMILSVNPYSVATEFTFYLPVVERTLSVSYDRSTRFISEDCGSEVSLLGLTVTSTDFDSVRIVNPVLSKARTTNIEIYR